MKSSVLILLICFFLSSCTTSIHGDKEDSAINKKVSELLDKMTIEEKVAQMRIFHANLGIELDADNNLILSDDVKERLKYGIAGIKNPGEHYSPERAAILNNKLQKYIIDNNRLGIPALFVTESYNGVDAEGCTRFGRPITLSSSWDTELIREVYDCMGREARLRGLHMTHSPVADIARDPRFGRMSESFGEDTYLVTEMIVNAVIGLQGDYEGMRNRTHIGAVTKHFAGYSQVAGGRNFASVELSPRVLEDEIFPPFKAAVQRGKTLGMMAAHGDLNGEACHGSRLLLTDILRTKWGFRGYVVSDANDIGRLHHFMKVAESPEAAAKMGIIAGVDIDLYGKDAYALLPEMVKQNPSLEQYINQAAGRILRAKFILGMFENPYTDPDAAKNIINNSKSRELAHRADLESLILLKNKSSVLPIKSSRKLNISLVGPLLGDDTKKYFESVASDRFTFADERGFYLTTHRIKGDNDGDGDESDINPSLTPEDDIRKGIAKIVNVSRNSDVIFLFLGGDEFTAREAFFNGAIGDRDDINPVGLQGELLVELKKTGKPIVVVLKHRRTLSINTISEYADAIIDCWDLSHIGDMAVAKIAFGDEVPSGKLSVTVPRSAGQLPFHYSQKGINFKKGYLFKDSTPLYPFGFGLSYTTFKYTNLTLSDSTFDAKTPMVVSVDVENTGAVAAKEVVQLYLSDKCRSVLAPARELKGFVKIKLEAGEKRNVTFEITREMVEFSGLDMKRIVESGEYIVGVGGNSHDLLTTVFMLNDN